MSVLARAGRQAFAGVRSPAHRRFAPSATLQITEDEGSVPVLIDVSLLRLTGDRAMRFGAHTAVTHAELGIPGASFTVVQNGEMSSCREAASVGLPYYLHSEEKWGSKTFPLTIYVTLICRKAVYLTDQSEMSTRLGLRRSPPLPKDSIRSAMSSQSSLS